jgi:hypothetical protein|tara:strand:+ start:137 stop:433 length:297 start_codon:yes stop_codon:yes gene_type:complete
MSHKLDNTKKAWDIFIAQAYHKKPGRLTPKRQAYINKVWPMWSKYRSALIESGLYEGMSWSADRKWPKIDVDSKEKFTHNLLTKHAISHSFTINLDNV